MRHVALFGLSANPPTNTSGHAGIVRHIATLVDEARWLCVACERAVLTVAQLWVLPVFQHSFSSKRDLAPFDDRLAMCQLGLASAAPNVRVLDVERTVCEAATQARLPVRGPACVALPLTCSLAGSRRTCEHG
jgi:nicotinic acid mononucleotide adenylyltransferase